MSSGSSSWSETPTTDDSISIPSSSQFKTDGSYEQAQPPEQRQSNKKSTGQPVSQFWNDLSKPKRTSMKKRKKSGRCRCRGPTSLTTIVTRVLRNQFASCDCDPAVLVALRDQNAPSLPACFRRAPQVVFIPNPLKRRRLYCGCCSPPCCCCPQTCEPSYPGYCCSCIKRCCTCWCGPLACAGRSGTWSPSSHFNNCNFY